MKTVNAFNAKYTLAWFDPRDNKTVHANEDRHGRPQASYKSLRRSVEWVARDDVLLGPRSFKLDKGAQLAIARRRVASLCHCFSHRFPPRSHMAGQIPPSDAVKILRKLPRDLFEMKVSSRAVKALKARSLWPPTVTSSGEGESSDFESDSSSASSQRAGSDQEGSRHDAEDAAVAAGVSPTALDEMSDQGMDSDAQAGDLRHPQRKRARGHASANEDSFSASAPEQLSLKGADSDAKPLRHPRPREEKVDRNELGPEPEDKCGQSWNDWRYRQLLIEGLREHDARRQAERETATNTPLPRRRANRQ